MPELSERLTFVVVAKEWGYRLSIFRGSYMLDEVFYVWPARKTNE